MATLKKYDMSGKEVGHVQVDDALLEIAAHPQSIKDYIVAIRYNARQWSANTKTRAQINRTGKKPHPQKGQGRSRQGDLAAPHYKGGGIVFGPKPKFDVSIRINKKEKRAAIRYMIAEKIKSGRVHVLKNEELKAPKTSKMAEFFEKTPCGVKRTLIVGEAKKEMEMPNMNLMKSVRNLPKKEFVPLSQVNGYSLALCQDIVVLDSAWDELLAMLGGGA
ncbi:MAG: 50S ribosomal protein L4 [Chlamydiia bacterium]|nr:50S ribosomal protein L4 [Chlamydiia bacterium]